MGRRDESVRVSLRLSKSAKDRLDRVKERSQAESLTEVIRNSIALYEALLDEKDSGSKVILRDAEGVEREVLLIY